MWSSAHTRSLAVRFSTTATYKSVAGLLFQVTLPRSKNTYIHREISILGDLVSTGLCLELHALAPGWTLVLRLSKAITAGVKPAVVSTLSICKCVCCKLAGDFYAVLCLITHQYWLTISLQIAKSAAITRKLWGAWTRGGGPHDERFSVDKTCFGEIVQPLNWFNTFLLVRVGLKDFTTAVIPLTYVFQ